MLLLGDSTDEKTASTARFAFSCSDTASSAIVSDDHSRVKSACTQAELAG